MKKIAKILFIVFYYLLLQTKQTIVYGLNEPLGFQVQGEKIPKITIPIDWRCLKKEKAILDLTNLDRTSGYLIFKKNYLDLANINTLLKLNEIIEEFESFISLGEYEPITFAVHALEDLKNVSVSVTDLVNEKGKIISKTNIDIRVVSLFPRKVAEKKYKLLPLILEKKDYFDIGKNTTRQFWLTIFVPEEAREGIYIGKIYFRPENKMSKEIKLKVNVIPLRLDKPDINYGLYYNMDNRWKGFYPQNMKKDFIDIKEHGLTSLTIFNYPSISKSEDGSIKFNFDGPTLYFQFGLNEVMDTYLNSGLKGPIPYLGVWYGLLGEISKTFGYKEGTPEFDKIYIEALKAIENHRKMKNWPEFLYSPEDEPTGTEKKFKSAKHNLQLIKLALPNNKIYMTLNGLSKGIDDGAILNSWVDVRCYPFLNEKIIKATNDAKDELWMYNGGSEGLHPILDRFFYGFYAVKSGARGIYQWVYQWPSSLNATPYNELTQERQGWYYTYPSPEGPVPTPAWEAIREGIDDAKYLYTLEGLIKKAKNSKDSKTIEEAVKSEEKIKQILNRINLNFYIPQKTAHAILGYAPNWKVEILDEWRKILAERILVLDKLLKGK